MSDPEFRFGVFRSQKMSGGEAFLSRMPLIFDFKDERQISIPPHAKWVMLQPVFYLESQENIQTCAKCGSSKAAHNCFRTGMNPEIHDAPLVILARLCEDCLEELGDSEE
jgi:hypothetical protein